MITFPMLVFHAPKEGNNNILALINVMWCLQILAQAEEIREEYFWSLKGATEADHAVSPKADHAVSPEACIVELVWRGGRSVPLSFKHSHQFFHRDGMILVNFLSHPTNTACRKVVKPAGIHGAHIEKMFCSASSHGTQTCGPICGAHENVVKTCT
jgi:hypothetical protein